MELSLDYVSPTGAHRQLLDPNQDVLAAASDYNELSSASASLKNTRLDAVTIFGLDMNACAATAVACSELALDPIVCPDTWREGFSGRSVSALVLVHGIEVDGELVRLAQTCRSLGALRLVLIGPPFGSCEAEQALMLGFDEIWPADMARRLCVTLVQKAWQTASQLSVAESASTLQFGPLSLGRSQDRCTYQQREVSFSRDSLTLLRVLITHYPQAVSRQTLIEAMGKLSKDLTSDTRMVDMAIARLRQRLRVCQLNNVVVSTVHGLGYCVELV